MGGEMNKATAQRLLHEVWNQQNLDALSEVFTADMVYHRPGRDDMVGRNSFREFGEALLSNFPDIQFEAKALLAEGDYVALHWAFHATGKGVKMEGIDVYRMSGGQIAEIWTVRGD